MFVLCEITQAEFYFVLPLIMQVNKRFFVIRKSVCMLVTQFEISQSKFFLNIFFLCLYECTIQLKNIQRNTYICIQYIQ